MNNFRCKKCGKEVFIPSFRISTEHGDVVYREKKTGDKILCCESPMEIIVPEGDIQVPNIATFESMPIEQKEKYFKDLSRRDFKKNGLDYIREAKKRERKNNNPI